MIEILPESEGAFVALRITGKSDPSDFATAAPVLERAIREHGKIRALWEMRDFHGWTASGLWADTKFDLEHAADFARIAVVGEKRWQEWMAALLKRFVSAEVRYFPSERREEALRWARGH